jgi:hypothetical protein
LPAPPGADGQVGLFWHEFADGQSLAIAQQPPAFDAACVQVPPGAPLHVSVVHGSLSLQSASLAQQPMPRPSGRHRWPPVQFLV